MFVSNCTEAIADGTEGSQGKVIGNVATQNSKSTGGQLVINGNPRYATTNSNWRTKVVNFGETLGPVDSGINPPTAEAYDVLNRIETKFFWAPDRQLSGEGNNVKFTVEQVPYNDGTERVSTLGCLMLLKRQTYA